MSYGPYLTEAEREGYDRPAPKRRTRSGLGLYCTEDGMHILVYSSRPTVKKKLVSRLNYTYIGAL